MPSLCAAVWNMRRTPHEGQKPRRLQLNATSLSWPQSLQRRRKRRCARMPHTRKASNSCLTSCGRSAPAGSSASAKKVAARDDPEVVSPHGLKPGTASQSPCVPPAKVCPPLRGLQRCPCSGPTGSFGATTSGQRTSLQGRVEKFATLAGLPRSCRSPLPLQLHPLASICSGTWSRTAIALAPCGSRCGLKRRPRSRRCCGWSKLRILVLQNWGAMEPCQARGWCAYGRPGSAGPAQ